MNALASSVLLLSASLCGVGLTACSGGASKGSPATMGNDAGVATTVKAPVEGLIDMQDIRWHDSEGGEPTFTTANVAMFPGLFGGIVLNATWDAIEPTAGGALDFGTIDAALDQVRQYNAMYPATPLGVKLRVYASSSAPVWAKQIGGGPVSIVRNTAGCPNAVCPLTVGKFWSPDYIHAWQSFQSKLAARYDTEPLIRQVAVTSCTSQTDEPFVPTTDMQSRANLVAAGYTDVAEQSCLSGAVADYAAWKLTLVDFTINTFVKIAGGTDDAFALATMKGCRDALHERCVLGNHALSAPPRASDATMDQAMMGLGGPISFQTQAPAGMGCLWTATIAQGVAYGATSIEVWPEAKYQGFDALTDANVQELASEFSTPIPVPSTPPVPNACPGFH
jgi:hypothetical protein